MNLRNLFYSNPFHEDVIAFHKYKVLYFAIPKVASSSLKGYAVNLLADEIEDKYKNKDWGPYTFRNKESRNYLYEKRILLQRLNKVEKTYFKFAFVRNPYDRIVSCYFNKFYKTDKQNNLVTDKNYYQGVE